MNNEFRYTVIIPTFNESKNIEKCLQSLVGAHEILIVDSFSTDNTPDLVESYGVKLLQNPFYSHGDQINWSSKYATNDWIFVLDADELFNAELISELNYICPPSESAVYKVHRVNYFLGKRINHGLWSADSPIRLFNRNQNCYNVQRVHSSISCNGPILKLKSSIKHFSVNSIDQYLEKMKRFSGGASIDLLEKQKKFSVTITITRAMYRFFKGFIVYQGYKDGLHGLLLATLESMYVFLKYMKLWELENKYSNINRSSTLKQGSTKS